MEEGKADSEPQITPVPNTLAAGTEKSGSTAKHEDSKSATDQKQKLEQEKRQDEPKVAGDSKRMEESKSKQKDLYVNTDKRNDDHLGGEEREDFDHEENAKNWFEYRVVGKAPRRRAYHAAFVYNNYYYIHGGYDIREGSLESMYRINLNPKSNENSWELIHSKGEKPGKIGFHTLCRYENKAYLFGGSECGVENKKLFEFDIETNEWRVVFPLGSTSPYTRDEHTALLWNNCMVVFGGSAGGYKMNDTWLYHIKDNKWEQLETEGDVPELSNHGGAIVGDQMYVFGRKDSADGLVRVLWKLDLKTKKWTEVEQKGEAPIGR